MIGLDGSIVNKKNEDDPYGIAVTKKISTPVEQTPKSNLNTKPDEKRNQPQKPQKPVEPIQSNTSKYPKMKGPPSDPFLELDDMRYQEQEVEEPPAKPLTRQQQKPSTGQLLQSTINYRKSEGVSNTRLNHHFSEGPNCK